MTPSFKTSSEGQNFKLPEESYNLGNFYQDFKEAYRDSCLGIVGALDYKFTGGLLNADFLRIDPINNVFMITDGILGNANAKSDFEQRFSQHVQNRLALQDHLVCGELPLPGGGFAKATSTITRCLSKGAKNLTLIDLVIQETLESKGMILSRYKLSAQEALQLGEKFLGISYREIGKTGSGVFRSTDGLRQFRIDVGSISGEHAPGIPHVHLEIFKKDSTIPYINNHIQFYE
jgi:hypothetical protein